MDLQERINILQQGAEVAQKNGILTLDEAYYAKQAIDALKNNVSHKAAFDILIKLAINAQKKGVYTLKDAHLLYLASENVDVLVQQIQQAQLAAQNAQNQPTPAPQGEKKPRTKKES